MLVVSASQLSFGTRDCSPKYSYLLLYPSDLNGVVRRMLGVTLRGLKVTQPEPEIPTANSDQLQAHTNVTENGNNPLAAGQEYKNQESVMSSYCQKKLGAGTAAFHPHDHT